MKLPARPAPKRRNETVELTRPIEAALNRLPGVRVCRNNVGQLEWAPGKRLVYGLGLGSADLVGIVKCNALVWEHGAFASDVATISTGRVFCLEVKRPGRKLEPDQARWAKAVRDLGGFCAVVHSVPEALACVDRCRAGLSE